MKIDSNQLQRGAFLLFAALCAMIITGCGGKDMVRVRGKVHYTDGTVPQGGVAIVRFSPTDDSTAQIRKGAHGPIEADGSFEMMTQKPGDGVYRGTYNVSFVVRRVAMDSSTSLIAPKFNQTTGTGITVVVDGAKSDLDFQIERLPAAAGAPPATATKSAGT